MIWAVLPAVIAGSSLSAGVNCTWMAESNQSCVHVIGCIEKPDRWTSDLSFKGYAQGWDAGTVNLEISDGQTCAGTWEGIGEDGIKSDIICSGSLQLTIDAIAIVDNDILSIGGRDNIDRDVRGWVGRLTDIETLVAQTTFARLTNRRTCYIDGYGQQPQVKD